MVNRTDGLLYEMGQGYSALDAQSARDRLDGYAVVSGLDVSPGGSLSVDVTAGEAIAGTDTNGNTITVSPGSTQNVSLAAADSAKPRKDTVWIDDTGTAQVTTGTAETALPEGNSRFNTFQPEPPFPGGDGTILAEVYVAAGASSLTSADIRDRRQPADIVGESIQTASADHESVSTDEALLDALDNWTDPAETAPLSISATTKGHTINFQNIEDKPTDPENSQLQYATQYFYTAGTENGGTPEQLALFGSDANNEELSIYTKSDAVGSGNTQTHKRMDIEAGAPETEVLITSLDSETRLRVEGKNENRSYLDWMNDGEFEFSLFYDPSVGTEGTMEFFDLAGGNGSVLIYEKDNRLWDFNDAAVSGLREISSPTAGDLASQEWAWDSTNSRWLYKDSGGTVHYFTPDGTL